jgi:hypothetical protein
VITFHNLNKQTSSNKNLIRIHNIGDTGVIITDKNFDDFCTLANSVLCNMNNCFTANKLALILDKTKIMKFVTNNSPQCALSIGYNGQYIEESANTKLLDLQIDNHQNWKYNIGHMIQKLSGACYAIRSCFTLLTLTH